MTDMLPFASRIVAAVVIGLGLLVVAILGAPDRKPNHVPMAGSWPKDLPPCETPTKGD